MIDPDVLAEPMPPVPRNDSSWAARDGWYDYLRRLRLVEEEAIATGDKRRESIAWSRARAAEREWRLALDEDSAAAVTRYAAEEEELRLCVLRSESVRDRSSAECAAARLCFLCGGPLVGAQRRWCRGRSIPCWETWAVNHSWTSARREAVLRSSGLPASAPWTIRYHAGRCDECGAEGELEVNHVEPRVGRGYGNSCAHHQSNLQVLDHPCHVVETNRQAAERRAADDPSIPLWGAA